jgi:hypothetical protein
MTTRALLTFPKLNVHLRLEDPLGRVNGWEVHLRRGGTNLQTWMEGSEAAATKRFNDVETLLHVLEALESRSVQ